MAHRTSTNRIRMNRRLLTWVSALAFAMPSVCLLSSVAAPGTSSRVDDDTPLGERMSRINKHMKALRKQLKDPASNADSLARVLEMQTLALEAKAFDPVRIKAVQGDEATHKFRVDYRKGMHDMLTKLFALELAFLEGDADMARTAYRALGKTKSPSHKLFKPKKKKQ